MRDSASGFRTQAEGTARNGENAFLFPLKVTSDGIVMDEYAHLENCAIARTHDCRMHRNGTFLFEEEELRLKKRSFVGFVFVIAHLQGWRLSAGSSWPET